MDPQPFPRRFLGNIRSMTRNICNQGTRIENVVAAPYENFPNTKFTSQDSTPIDISQLVTDLVTVNGNRSRGEDRSSGKDLPPDQDGCCLPVHETLNTRKSLHVTTGHGLRG